MSQTRLLAFEVSIKAPAPCEPLPRFRATKRRLSAGPMREPLRLVVAFTAGLMLTACSDAIQYSVSAELSNHAFQAEREGLDAAVTDSLGPELNSGDNSGTFSQTVVNRKRSSAAVIRVRGDYPVTKRIAVVGDIAISKGAGKYFLPYGAQAFTDPATVKFSSVAANTTLGVAYKVSFPSGVSTELSTGLGHRTARINTRITSALLATNSTAIVSNQFAFVGGKLAYDTTSTFKRPSSVFVQSRVKRFKTGQYDFGVSIGVGLQ